MARSPDSTDTPLVMEMPIASNTGVSGRWLMVVRILWMLIVSLTLWVLVASIPTYFAALSTLCTVGPCADYQLTPSTLQTLQPLGISLSRYSISFFVFKCLAILPWYAVAVLIAWRKFADWFALVVALFLVLLGTFENIQVETILSGPHTLWWLVLTGLVFLTFTLFFLVFSLFPSGRFVPQWIGFLCALWCLFLLSVAFFQGTPFDVYTWSEPLGNLIWFGLLGTTGVAQIYRYRRVSDPVQRQQTKWVAYLVAVISTLFVGISLLFVLVPALNQPTSLFPLVRTHLIDIIALLIPCSIGMAILRYRLWDIDIIINRTLVYGTLTGSVAGIYTLVVGGLGTLLQAQGNLVLSLLATVLVAVLFQPLRIRLQRTVNRLMYGERDDPYRVISRLGQRLAAVLAPEAVLPTIVEMVAQTLKLPYAAITLMQGEELVLVASHGTARGEAIHLPLVYQAEQVGELVLAPRAPGESFTPADRRLLEDLARQTGVAAYAVHLTEDLKRLTVDLQRSREHLVTAREEERRRLRRDLHDGLGPQLASLTLKLETARNRLAHDPLADTLLSDLTVRTQTAVADIRRLVYALRPPALDELGLVAALREQVLQYMDQGQSGLSISFNAPESLPEVSAAVEVAAYRIVQEALTNVVRHAQACHCTICLALDEAAGTLTVEVYDDGRGWSSGRKQGVGLTSMRERAAELGGRLSIEPVSTGGLAVRAQLPCSLPTLSHDESRHLTQTHPQEA